MSNSANNPTGIMRRALRLAEKGKGSVLSNPMVGAVIIKNGERISEAYHQKFGGDHAEALAIKAVKGSLDGAALYVTLEPCCHYGKTPPCTDAIIKSGIKKVVIASLDPSEKACGKGIKILEKAGIEIEVGLLKDAAEKLNEQFYTFHRQKRPFISLKAAISLDGKISASKNVRTYLTGDKAKKMTDILRNEHHAVLVGGGTVEIDNPNLGLSTISGREPLRIILGKESRFDKNLKIFRNANYLIIDEKDLKILMHKLYDLGVISILLEGGHDIFTSFLDAGLYDRLYFYIAPIILGPDALNFADLKSDISIKFESVQKLGPDIMISATKAWESQIS